MEFECRSGRSGGFGPEELDCIAPGGGQDGQELNVQSLQIQTDGQDGCGSSEVASTASTWWQHARGSYPCPRCIPLWCALWPEGQPEHLAWSWRFASELNTWIQVTAQLHCCITLGFQVQFVGNTF